MRLGAGDGEGAMVAVGEGEGWVGDGSSVRVGLKVAVGGGRVTAGTVVDAVVPVAAGEGTEVGTGPCRQAVAATMHAAIMMAQRARWVIAQSSLPGWKHAPCRPVFTTAQVAQHGSARMCSTRFRMGPR
jgi:hypothetical protein